MRIYRSSDDMKFRTNNTDKLTISSSGDATFENRVVIKDDLRILGAGG